VVVIGVGMILLGLVLVVEIAGRVFLGNMRIANMEKKQDGRCVGLTPGAAETYTGWLLRIPAVTHEANALGYRGPERPTDRSPDTFRILAIGDSTTYGQGCAAGDSYPAQLESELAARGRRVEVLNFGVPGYNVEEYVDQYEHFASRWQHDLVVVAFSANDLDPPICSHLDSPVTSWLIMHSYSARLLIFFVFRDMLFGDPDGAPSDPSRVRTALARIRHHAKQSGANVVVTNKPPGAWLEEITGTSVRAICDELAVPFYDLDTCRLPPTHEPVEFSVIPGDTHLDAAGNKMTAQCIADFLQRNGHLRRGNVVAADGSSP
jgi:lysophospholipase L1-like esterase